MTDFSYQLYSSREMPLAKTLPMLRQAGYTAVEGYGALYSDPEQVAERMLRLATEGTIESADGSLLRLDAQSICVHGDNPAAVTLARRIRDRLVAAGVSIAPFHEAAR